MADGISPGLTPVVEPARGYHKHLSALLGFGLDAAIVAGSYAIALLLRFDGSVPDPTWRRYAYAIAPIVIAYLAANMVLGVYRTAWRYGSLRDVINLGTSVAVVTAGIFIINLLLPSPRHIPLSVNLVAGVLTFLAMTFVKLWPRLIASYASPFGESAEGTRRVLIFGAGDTGQLLAREMLHNRYLGYRPVGFVDDDPYKRGIRIHGLPVLGTRYDIVTISRKYAVELIALADGSGDIREIVTISQTAGVPVQIVPSLADIVSGRARPAQLREVTVDDLLEREALEIDYVECSKTIRGRRVLVTGAAGSIGSEISRQLLSLGPASLHLLDNNESGLHDLLTQLLPNSEECELKLWVASVADRPRLQSIFQSYQPEVVFHAAAYKHVPLMEDHPEEAFRVNVLGTLNLCQAAMEAGTEKFVFISTDKAVKPTSVMGATKRIGELMIATMGQSQGGTTFCAVRFGNVMGSRGSVIPLFWQQIQMGGPISVTHPDMRRYFLTVPEAASLVIQAATFAQQGQIYLLDMGEEVRIVDLAEKMIRLGGLKREEVEIIYTGLRPGEKLREELVEDTETLVATAHPKVFLAQREQPRALSGQRLIAAIHKLQTQRELDSSDLASRIHALALLDEPNTNVRVI